MNGASLQRSAILSFLLHITLFGITLWAARHSNHFVMPSPYVVNLVGPESAAKVQESPPKAESEPAPQTRTETTMSPKTSKTVDKSKEQYLNDRIAALEAKKKIETIGRLRDIVTLKGGKRVPVTSEAKQGKRSTVDDYAVRIGEEIRQHWEFPTDLLKDKNIEAIVSIRIQKSGSLQIINVEKSSGNPLFDRSALRAITKASPVTQPLQEMEIGVRFYP